MSRGNTYQTQEILNSVYDADNETLKTNVSLSGDVEIGAVEIKNAADDTRAVVGYANSAVIAGLALNVADANVALNTIRSAANSARGTGTPVACVQPLDASGNVLGMTAASTARLSSTVVLPIQQLDASGHVFNITEASTARLSSTTVLPTQILDASGTVNAMQGVRAHDAADAGNPVKMGFYAADLTSMPADVAVGDIVNGVADLKGRQIIYLGTTLDAVNDTVGSCLKAHSTITGLDTAFNSALSNTGYAIKGSPGNLYSLDATNGGATLNSSPSYLQFFDVASAAVTAGTTNPKYVVHLPANGAVMKDLATPMTFATAISVLGATTPTGGSSVSNALTCSFGYK